ncbi:GNAT family N-acetyltransferase [Verrucomicrobiota bacterium]
MQTFGVEMRNGAKIRSLRTDDHSEWRRMRLALYSSDDPGLIEKEIEDIAAGILPMDVLVAERSSGGLVGFVELTVEHNVVGCKSSPVGYIGSWYVDPDHRQAGVGRELLLAAEDWAAGRGCREMGSDCEIDNEISRRAHIRIGYVETERLIHFRKPIKRGPNRIPVTD